MDVAFLSAQNLTVVFPIIQVHEPWKLGTCKDFMVRTCQLCPQISFAFNNEATISVPVFIIQVFKYQEDKKEICKGVLSNHLKRRMTHAQLERACKLAMAHKDIHWAVTLRCVSAFFGETGHASTLTGVY